MFNFHKTGTVLAGLVLSATIQSATASCLSYHQAPEVDTSFSPLKLHFNVHIDTQWVGLNQAVAVDQTFSQVVVLNTLYLPDYDGCNDQATIRGNTDSIANGLTDDVSDYVGRDFSLDADYLTYTIRDAGYQTQQGLTLPTFDQILTIGAADYDPVLDPATGEYFYSDYARGFSTRDLGQVGYYGSNEDLLSYLNSLVGVREFDYFDFSIFSKNYIRFDKYGYEGTAVLTSISAVPLPGSLYLFAASIATLAISRRRSASA